MKGIGEVLEGLIPYSQRHFTRVDRLERSTFLLDYTLTGMSVIEPERNDAESRDEDLKSSKAEDDENSKETVRMEGEDYMEPKETSIKKRKSRKSQDRKQKKTKVAYISAATISSEA